MMLRKQEGPLTDVDWTVFPVSLSVYVWRNVTQIQIRKKTLHKNEKIKKPEKKTFAKKGTRTFRIDVPARHTNMA